MGFQFEQWNPVPEHLNRFSLIQVVHLSESLLMQPGFYCLITTSSENLNDQQTKAVWRIAFQRVAGYRHLPLRTGQKVIEPAWPYDASLRPDENPAMWEIKKSSFIKECVVPFRGKDRTSSYSHFVIAELYSYYEFVAQAWESVFLPENWQELRRKLLLHP